MARKSSAPPSSSSSPPPPSSSVLLSRQYDKDGIMNDDYDQRINIWWDCLDPENPEIDIYDHHHFNTCPSSFGGGSGSTSIVDNDFSASLPPGPDPQLYYFSQFGQGEEVVVEEGGAAAAALGGDDDEEDLFGCSSSCSGLFSPDSDFWGLLS
ncbi:OLC1v1010628C1 [Oldenlandia corymbosa var. corymbosa]|uniref:OLC1v1010628C1 n=1 Tax=Oldenlandia corymbosa var. corymbosa TaxID=529605 RepID=A0AAV1DRS9_OLDCO|nr:OLC1v1010628C1 [Oldenlandia corymbosa var. corymbosa]